MNSKNLSRRAPDEGKFPVTAFSQPLLIGFLVLLTCIIYLPVLQADFLWYDDDMMVSNNPFITSLSFSSILNLFNFENIVHYHPLVLISYAVEHSLFGLDPFYFHLDNLLLHTVNVILVYFLAAGISRNKSASLMTALLFAVHPLHVESVAWVTERKDLLFSLFYLLSLIFYVKYAGKRLKRLYVYSLIFFVLSCLSKAMAVTLPLVIILIEFTIHKNSRVKLRLNNIKQRLAIVWPFIIVSVLTSLINLKVAYYETGIGIYSLYERLALVCYAVLFYPVKMLLPFELSAIYSFQTQPGAVILSSPFILTALVLLLFANRKKTSRDVKFGLIFYIITIIPILPIFPFGISSTADRFAYIPLIGLFYIVAVLLVRLYNKYRDNQIYINYITAGLVVVILLFSILTYSRAEVWKNTETLMNDVLDKDPGSYHAYYILGNYCSAKNNSGKAINCFLKCLELKANYSEAHYNLGNVYFNMGNFIEAEKCFLKAVELNPMDKLAHNNLGVTYENLGQYDKAFRYYKISSDLGYEPARHVLRYYGVVK